MSQDIETRTGTAVETPPRTVDVAVVGAGYVGLPLAQTFAEAGRTRCSSRSFPRSSRR